MVFAPEIHAELCEGLFSGRQGFCLDLSNEDNVSLCIFNDYILENPNTCATTVSPHFLAHSGCNSSHFIATVLTSVYVGYVLRSLAG